MAFEGMLTDRTMSANQRAMDQRLFAVILVWIWLGVVVGFGFDISQDLHKGPLHFLPIVHVHAMVFVGWMVLFTCQLMLIRSGKTATHKRLGVAMAWLVAVMIVLGISTTYEVDRFRASHPGSGDPTFFIVATAAMVIYATLAVAGLSMRKHPDVHKRLMLMSTICLTEAGFARIVPVVIVPLVSGPFLRTFLISYLCTNAAMLAIGLHDWLTRQRLFPAYVFAMVFVGCIEVLATWMYVDSPAIHAAVLAFLTD